MVESEDGDIDPLGHGITSKTLPQVASPGESSQLPCFCSTILFGQRLNLNLEFHSRHDREWYIENMSAGKPTAILVGV